MATPVQQESAYIYCILLPFQCTPATVALDEVLRPGRHLSPPHSVCRVAKVGITKKKNPAERLYDIFSAFEKLGEPLPQSLLRTLSQAQYVDPQTAIAKTKMIDEIIFIESVHTPGSAEKDIRTILQTGEYNLSQEFFIAFEAKVPKEKKGYLDVIGVTEWIMMKNGLASMLQQKFRAPGGGIYELRLFWIPSGEQLTHAVNEFCGRIASSRGSARAAMAMGGPRPPLVIKFKATNFTYIIQ